MVSDWVSLGGLGILAGFLGVAVRTLFAQSTRTLDLERERNAALVAELAKLNAAIQDRVLVALGEVGVVLARSAEARLRRPEDRE